MTIARPVRPKNPRDPVGWVILDAVGNVICPYTLRPAADEIVTALNRGRPWLIAEIK